VTAVIDRLEQIGFAHRVADPADRRRVLVELTPHGVETIAELMGPLAEQGRSLLSGYSDEQLELLLEFTRAGREMQERHAERLRARVAKAP
jgi:DNA-binding MarR family transcriptional regulator